MLTNRYRRVPCADIIVKRSDRDRSVVEVDDLLPSIRRWGVINPITITHDFVLIAGERRLTASIALGLPDIPCRYADDALDSRDRKVLELEENVKRLDLTWQDQCKAIARLHALYSASQENWSEQDTAEALGFGQPHVNMNLRVARELEKPDIATQTSMRTAFNMLSRAEQRKTGDAISSILEQGSKIFGSIISTIKPTTTIPEPSVIPEPAPTIYVPPPDSILNVDFLEWAPTYSDKPFNFIHCDFPFINVFDGNQSGRKSTTTYKSDKDVYWALIQCLCANLDRLMAHSAHLMFWFSMEYYSDTLEFFRKNAPSLEFQLFPLLWLKSDNVGILPDPKRGPRRIYETALIASREDRFIVRPVSNGYQSPTDKTYHISTKPEPMLRHFFQMFVDSSTRLLDPTCGSGSALRAAESLGASHVLGLESNKEHYENAQSALRKFRALRKAI